MARWFAAAGNIAADCKHVTVLQRSPTYFFPRKNENPLTDQLRALDIDPSWIHEISRQQILQEQAGFIATSTQYPNEVKKALIEGVQAHLPEGFDVEKHFTPDYNPWRQRIAVVPNGGNPWPHHCDFATVARLQKTRQ